MHFDVVTIFPEMLDPVMAYGVVGRAREREIWSMASWNPRDFTADSYRRIDDRPYGGGPGMVMMAEPLAKTVEHIHQVRHEARGAPAPVVYLSPQGKPLTHELVESLAREPLLTLVAGRYEGIDQRFIDAHVTHEVSIGDFVVSGGELPALMLIDAIVRTLPEVLNDPESANQDSHVRGLFDCPHYTRPDVWRDRSVPEVLRGGDHARIERWRHERALALTLSRRPDLISKARSAGWLSAQDETWLAAQVSSK